MKVLATIIVTMLMFIALIAGVTFWNGTGEILEKGHKEIAVEEEYKPIAVQIDEEPEKVKEIDPETAGGIVFMFVALWLVLGFSAVSEADKEEW